jgi:hypothetical protein
MSRNSTLAIYESTYYLGIVYAKLATNRKLCGVSTYLPIPEALCLECVWNTHSTTMISSPRLRPLGGKAEHESGLPVARYRYTCGKTRRYGNSQVQVTSDHRSTQIWVLFWVM